MSIDELAFIDRLRALATHPAARGLEDDVAVVGDLVLTHDTIAEGVHYLPDDPPASVGWKLVTVNLSDLAAKGAEPVAALMSVTISGDGDWEDQFLSGVAAACEAYSLPLVGGDTIALPLYAPRVFGLTAIGRGGNRIPSRGGGSPGDGLWLVGTLGDAAVGSRCPAGGSQRGRPVGRSVSPSSAATCRRARTCGAGQRDDGCFGRAIARCFPAMRRKQLRRANRPGQPASVPSLHCRAGIGPKSPTVCSNRGRRLCLAGGASGRFRPQVSLSLPSGTILARIGTLTDGKGLTLFDATGDVPMPEQLGYEHHA